MKFEVAYDDQSLKEIGVLRLKLALKKYKENAIIWLVLGLVLFFLGIGMDPRGFGIVPMIMGCSMLLYAGTTLSLYSSSRKKYLKSVKALVEREEGYKTRWDLQEENLL